MTASPAPHPPATEAFLRFLHSEAAGGLVLIGAAALALVLTHSPLAHGYHAFWERHLLIQMAGFSLDLSLHQWVNEGLMTVFFLLVGMEIKRELVSGELASPRKAALPAIAALGGMVVPALIYVAVAARTPYLRGWGMPMATDIAFAVGVMALLGPRAPLWLRVYLTALAIVDDLGAVAVIAVFYTGSIAAVPLMVAGGATALLLLLNRLGVRRLDLYLLLGAVLWLAVLHSGVHATIAGVVLGLTIPSSVRHLPEDFVPAAEAALARYCSGLEECRTEEDEDTAKETREAALAALEDLTEGMKSPLHRLEHELHGAAAFLILPLFALANAGVTVRLDEIGAAARHPVTLGIFLGLVVGKPVGIFGASWLALRLRLGELPAEGRLSQLLGAAVLAGIGFTMSIFIAGLAFTDPALLATAKIGIFAASILAGLAGALLLILLSRSVHNDG